MKYIAACLAYATATFTELTTVAEIDAAVELTDVVYKFTKKHIKDGKEHTIKSKESETLGVHIDSTATIVPDILVLGGDAFGLLFTATKAGSAGTVSYFEYLGAPTRYSSCR